MYSLIAVAANSKCRGLLVALIGVAAVLLLPFSAGAFEISEQQELNSKFDALGTGMKSLGQDVWNSPILGVAPGHLDISSNSLSQVEAGQKTKSLGTGISSYRLLPPTSTYIPTQLSSQYLSQNEGTAVSAPSDDRHSSSVRPSAKPVSVDELTLLLKDQTWQDTTGGSVTNQATRSAPVSTTFGPASPVTSNDYIQHQAIGTSYQIGLLGIQLQTGLELEKQTTATASTVTSRLSAQAPLNSAVSVNAELELVDVDRLRVLAERGNTENNDEVGQTRIGVGGKVQWSDFGSLRIGYELVHVRNSPYHNLATFADAGLEYSISARARLAAGFNVNSDKAGSKATTNVGVGYSISRNSSLNASYQLINFSDAESQEYQTNVAQAELTVKF